MASRLKTVLIYKGKGSNIKSSPLLLKALQHTLKKDTYDIRYVYPEEVIKGAWATECALIAFGGGFDLGYIESLGSEGISKIRDFVKSGGAYLGLCAGAYFACSHIEFDKGGPLEVTGPRDLSFYPGQCIGPAFPGYCYTTSKGVHAAPIKYKHIEVFHTYMNGGGYFKPYNNSSEKSSIKILGHFTTLPGNPAAVVKCHIGQGTAVLSNVHLEFFADHLEQDDEYLQKIFEHFVQGEALRDIVFADILEELGLSIRHLAKAQL